MQLAQQHRLSELTVESGDGSVRLRRAGRRQAKSQPHITSTHRRTEEIRAPLIGVFYRSPAPDAPPYVRVGDWIESDQTIGLIEAMKVFNEITSEVAGRVAALPVANGELVEAGQILVAVELEERNRPRGGGRGGARGRADARIDCGGQPNGMARDVIRIGILGFGKVGGGAYQVLEENADSIALKVGSRLEIARVADIDWQRPREVDLPQEKRATDARAVIEDPAIDIIVETIGGTDPALGFVLAALRAGKCVVTSNKELIAKHGREILEEADARGLDIYFEGAVGGGIPIIQPLKQSLAANRIASIVGIVNGTTNYILTQMASGGGDFAHALAEAQRKGYAEPDPTDDIEGNDAAYKLAILASIAFNSRAAIDQIYREGISRIAPADMVYARELGFVVKLLAIGRDRGDAVELRVHPAFLPQSHPLAAVSDVFNAIFVEGSAAGRLMFYGRGAGARPTGSAVVGDIIEVARNINHGARGRVPCTCFAERPVKPMDEVVTKHYVRMQVADRPGVLAKIAAVFGDEGVSLASVVQKAASGGGAEIVWVTHESLERAVRRSLDRIRALPEVNEISNWVRVEEG